MATGGSPPSQLKGLWETLSDDRIYMTMKFGFYQKQIEYRVNGSISIIDQLYRDAEEWLRSLQSHASITGSFTFYLFRIPTSDFTLIPILRQSDIEQNCLIEIILVPTANNKNAHSFYRCQLNIRTNCSHCTRFITGIYRQGFRCRKCRRTYHKNCASLEVADCPIDSNDEQPSRPINSSSTSTLVLTNSYKNEPNTEEKPASIGTNTTAGIPRTTIATAQAKPEHIEPNKIIDKGIFPACIRGSHVSRRLLFRLTTTTLSISTTYSQSTIEQVYLTQPGDNETFFLLTDIVKLTLTHKDYDRNDVFEIQFNNQTILSVGKRTDADELQMETAQFYSSIREQRETLLNATPPSPLLSPRPPPPPTKTTTTTTITTTAAATATAPKRQVVKLVGKPSLFSLAPKDLYEAYQFTGEKIGQGAFGRVVGGRKKATNEDVAIKIIEKTTCDEREMSRINDEINTLFQFNHVNILRLQAYYERDDAVYLITERMETDLCKYIMNKKPSFCLSERLARMIVYQLIVAVRYLHGKNCGHLDIKCDNILLTLLPPRSTDSIPDLQNEYPLVKLADFGYSRFIGEHSFRKTRVGTRVYNAPEVNHGTTGYNRLADMWSIGMVSYACLSGQLPYDEVGSRNAEKYVRDKKALFANKQWENISHQAKDLIYNKLLVISSSSRITSNNAIFDAWFTEFDLYCDLREIERRAAFVVSQRSETLPTSSHWLTGEREDEPWLEYRQLISDSERSS